MLKPSIFAKCRFRPTQIREVAKRRFGDAIALRRTRDNERANGAMYLGGYVIECLLKAKLMDRFPWLQKASSSQGRSRWECRLWSLCYRWHDLDELLAMLPNVTTKLSQLDQRGSGRLVQSLKSICAQWTVHVRYSPYSATMRQAKEFLDQVKELKRWLA